MSYTKDGTGNPITSTGNALDINIKSGAGGGGGPATIADGADVAQGTTTDVAWSSGAGTVIALLKKIASAGGSAVSVADGADVAQGAIADAAVTSDSNGTLSAKLRGLVKILADAWDSVNHRLNVAVQNFPATQAVSGSVTVSNLPATQPISGSVTATEANGYLLQVYDQLVVMTSLLQILVANSVQGLPPGIGLSDPAELGNPVN